MDLVIRSLDYYDNNREKFNKFISKVRYLQIQRTSKGDIDRKKLIFYDRDKEKIGISRIEQVGTYYHDPKLWVWSWANPSNEKNVTYLSRKILSYGLDITTDVKDINNIFLKAELITSRFKINDKIQLDIHIAISSYITKIPFILRYDLDITGGDIVYDKDDNRSEPLVKYKFHDDVLNPTNENEITNKESTYFFVLDYQELIK